MSDAISKAIEVLNKCDKDLRSMGYSETSNDRKGIIEAIAALQAEQAQTEPVAWMYTLSYGEKEVDRIVSQHQRRYPFGVCGKDYCAVSSDGVSLVREFPLFTKTGGQEKDCRS